MSESSGAATPVSTGNAEGQAPVQGAEGGEGQAQEQKQQQSQAAQARKAMLEKFSYVVDGQTIEEEVDLNNKEDLTKRLRLSAAATKRMAEAKEAQGKARQILDAFEKNPEDMLRRLGPKGRELAEKFLINSMQEDMLDPKEKELRTIKAENDAYKKEKEVAAKQKEQSQQSQQEAKIAESFQKTIIEAAEKSGLPKSPALIRRMAKILHTNVDLGLDLDAHDLAQEVKKDLISEIKAIIGDSDGSHLVELFGPDVAKKIRKFDLARLQESQSKLSNPRAAAPATAPKAQPNSYLTPEQWKEETARRVGQSQK